MMNRRSFFQTAAAAAGLPPAARSAANRVNIAIVGLRGRGKALAGSFATVPGVGIEYFVDVDQNVLAGVLAGFEKKTGQRPKLAGDLRRVLDDKSIDAVVVATPDHWHAPAAILACAAGKDVYVEKPCAHNAREARAMVAAARRHNRIVQHGTQARSRPATQRAIEVARSGKIGKVLMAKAWNVQMRKNIGFKPDAPVPAGVDYDTWIGPAPAMPFSENRFHYTWHWNWNYGTGDMGNDGAHQLDQARWALGVGHPLEVSGAAGKLYFDDDQQTPDTMTITFRYPGKMLLFEMRIWNPYAMGGIENGVAVYGSEGMLEIGKSGRVNGYRVYDRAGKLVHQEEDDAADTHAHNFIECVRSRKPPNAEIEVGRLSALHCHLGNIVARTGRGLKYDPATESIPGDAEADRLLGREYRAHWSTPQGLA
ncbi:MAG: Gfo/Idh/MocA family oxidoreductase [Acidobacteria bacterium]|nr:Gfo/Idh/MocA family oxidoreductase [Acidobacteriota bacterium]